ncbi:MAG: redoxin domain-containing protein [Planctomycetaceae bacterium]|nr:redoxin domain-containing protein [Planctomycetales bacterium]MCB9926793.1 redoxin domain-containing protein [Planctomycetaceae bacterium]
MNRLALTLLCCLLVLTVHADEQPISPRIGEVAPRFSLGDSRGKQWSSDDFRDQQVLVVTFLGTECPLVKLYSQRLQAMATEFSGQGVAFVGINPNQQDSLTELGHFAKAHEISFPLLKDPGNRVADQFGATRTPEVFVYDKSRQLRYHGRIDDQYTYGIQRPKVEHEYLREAIDALLTQKQVKIAETETIGCLIGRVAEPDPTSTVTYSKQISRILQRRCIECHREGEIAPFSLTSYDDAAGWGEMIAEVVEQQRMPPWHANPAHGNFANEARLTDEEKNLIYDWVASGAPEGDPSDLPPPQEFVDGWRIGNPDLIVKMSNKPFKVPAEGEVRYQYFSVDPGFREDKWVKAAECRPGNRAVVHHIIVAASSPERVAKRIHGDLESDWLTATAPGARPLILPDGLAKRIPAGSRLIFQMHYTPNGTEQEDLSSVGLVFADPETVKREVITQKAAQSRFEIPPGASNHEVTANMTFSQDTLMLAMFPHMHLRGKSFRYTATYPDNREEILLDIPHYDFNWQNSYAFKEAKFMPAGTKLTCVAHYDNSAANLANPDPTTAVRWGDQTWEEMMIGYFDMAIVDQDLTKSSHTRRTDEFLKQYHEGTTGFSEPVKQLARTALESDDTLRTLGGELLKVMPQLDRIDWVTLEVRTLHVRRVAQSGGAGQARSGLKVPAARLRLTEYAEGDQTVTHARTSEVNAPDFKLLGRRFASSMHVPVVVDDVRGVVSFWSTEIDAFPTEAVEILEPLAKQLGLPNQ